MPAAEIAAAITSVRAAIDLAKAALQARDNNLAADKLRELQRLLGDAYLKLIEAETSRLDMVQRMAALQAEIRKLRDWESEKERYELKSVSGGGTVYAMKQAHRGEQDPHWLCPSCFAKGEKSHLQFSVRASIGNVYRCSTCKGHLTTQDEPQ